MRLALLLLCSRLVARNPAKSLGSVPHSAAGERDVPRSQWRGSMIVGSLTGGATRSDWSHARQLTPVSTGLPTRTMRPSLARRQEVERFNCHLVSSFSRGQQLRDVC